MAHRRLVALLASAIAVAFLTLVAVVTLPAFSTPASSSSPPPPTVEQVSTPPVSSVDWPLMQQIADSQAAWYTAVAEEHARQTAAVNTGDARRVVAQAASAPVIYDGDRFDRLAHCESHGNPQAVSPGGKYRGAFQFSLTSWHSAGMDGDPIDFDYETQKATAMYWASITTPSTQWPVCWPRTA